MNPTNLPGAVLYAEDTEDDAFFFERAYRLAKIAHPLQIVTDGVFVLPYLEGEGAFADRAAFPLPHLVILDVKMPQLGGLEVLERIRARTEWKSLGVCLLTSSSQPRDLENAHRLGANAYIVKPTNAERLRGILTELNRLADGAAGGWWQFAGGEIPAAERTLSGRS